MLCFKLHFSILTSKYEGLVEIQALKWPGHTLLHASVLPTQKETQSHEWHTSTLRRKRTNILSLYCCPIFFPKFTWLLFKNAQVKCISTLPFQASFPSSNHSIFSHYAGKGAVWNMEYIPQQRIWAVHKTWYASYSQAQSGLAHGSVW